MIMEKLFKHLSVFMTLLLLSMSSVLASCGDDDEGPGSGEQSQTVSSVKVSYSVSLSDNWYKYFNIELSFTNSTGKTTVETLDMDKNMEVTYKFSESPDKIGLKVVAKPKANRPDVEDGVTYQLNKDICLTVLGVASNGSGYAFMFSEPKSSSMSSGGDAFRNFLDKEHVLYDQSYTIPR